MIRGRLLAVARVLFLLAVAGFAWWGLRTHSTEITAALARVDAVQVVVATVATFAAVFAAGPVWRRLLTSYGPRVPARAGYRVFFVGQLGKYIPGSVWSLGAQAQLATRFAARPRVTVAAGLMLLGWLGGSAALVAAACLLPVGALHGWAAGLVVLLAACSAAAFVPGVARRIAGRLAAAPAALTWKDSLRSLAILTGSWFACGVAVLALAGAERTASGFAAATGAYALAYAAGLAVPIAPAGLGARDAVLITLLAPTLGLGGAAATAVLLRVLITVADFAMAALWWAVDRSRRDPGVPVGENAAPIPAS